MVLDAVPPLRLQIRGEGCGFDPAHHSRFGESCREVLDVVDAHPHGQCAIGADRTSGPAEHRPRQPTRWTWTSAGVIRRSCRRTWPAPFFRQLTASHTCIAVGAVTTPPR